MSDFHQSPEWIALAKQHKAIERAHGRWKCKDCGYTGKAMESDHELSVKHWPMARLWLCGLTLRCGQESKNKCNQKKGAKFYYSPKSLKLASYYIMLKFIQCYLPWLIILWAVSIDVTRGPFDTTISYQIVGPAIEYLRMALDNALDAAEAWLSSRSE